MPADVLQDIYDSTLSTLLNKHARGGSYVDVINRPLSGSIATVPLPSEKKTRMFERRYRRTRSNADRRSWIDQTRRKQRLYASKQNQYWEDKIRSSRGNPSRMWTNLSAVLRREKTTPVTAGLATLRVFCLDLCEA